MTDTELPNPGQFSGFHRGTLYTPMPNPLFGPLLEQIQDLAELKVTLRGLWLLHQQKGWPRLVTLADFLNDRVLLRGLAGKVDEASGSREAIRRGLRLAVQRRTFLYHGSNVPDPARHFYLLNTESDRRALALLQRKQAVREQRASSGWRALELPAAERPSIFTLYEENIGTLSPFVADELREAEGIYPWRWLEEAFRIAVRENKRSWRYVEAILRRWADEGKGKGRENGKLGRHSQKDNRQKYLDEYQRRRGRLPWQSGKRGKPADR